MSMFDQAREKLTKAVDEHGDKIKEGLEKAGDAVDKKTGGKYSDKISKGKQAAAKGLDGLHSKQDLGGPAGTGDTTDSTPSPFPAEPSAPTPVDPQPGPARPIDPTSPPGDPGVPQPEPGRPIDPSVPPSEPGTPEPQPAPAGEQPPHIDPRE